MGFSPNIDTGQVLLLVRLILGATFVYYGYPKISRVVWSWPPDRLPTRSDATRRR
jgi:hypothetical protein